VLRQDSAAVQKCCGQSENEKTKKGNGEQVLMSCVWFGFVGLAYINRPEQSQ